MTTMKTTKKISFQKFKFEPIDNRSMGYLKFTAETKHGILKYEAYLGDGYSDIKEMSIDGKNLDDLDDETGDAISDCLDVPDFHNDANEFTVKFESMKAIIEFEKCYTIYLSG